MSEMYSLSIRETEVAIKVIKDFLKHSWLKS